MDSEGVTIEDKRMFGGLAIMVNGHMCCGIVGRNLVVRVGGNEYEQALSQPHARPMDFTGRAMRGCRRKSRLMSCVIISVVRCTPKSGLRL